MDVRTLGKRCKIQEKKNNKTQTLEIERMICYNENFPSEFFSTQAWSVNLQLLR